MPSSAPDQPRWDSAYHAPVLADAILGHVAGSRRALDCTLGGGGHSLAFLESGVEAVVGIDRDPDAIAEARARLAEYERAGRFRAVLGNYASADVLELGDEPFDAILLDLGISSHQVDDAARGFTFREGAPLDMRMGVEADASAAELLNDLETTELARIFRDYGDEPRAQRLAAEVVRRRATVPFATSDHLVGAIRGAFGPRTGPGDFARLFQALRIAVNDELGELERALPAATTMLRPGGRVAVISFHSLEDRVVKRFFRAQERGCVCPPEFPICVCGQEPVLRVLTKKAVRPSARELASNPRAASARLRVAEKA